MTRSSTPASSDHCFIIATSNAGKSAEFTQLLRPLLNPAWTIYDRTTFPSALPSIDEDQPTFRENALKKAVQTALATGCCALADDSGLAVDALNGAPGVHSARFAGDHADDQANNQLLLHRLQHTPKKERAARFITALAMALPKNQVSRTLLATKAPYFDHIPQGAPQQAGILGRQDDLLLVFFYGELHGQITTAPRGHHGFGYDPIFELPHLHKTLAQLPPHQKNKLSHRAKAAQKLHHFFA